MQFRSKNCRRGCHMPKRMSKVLAESLMLVLILAGLAGFVFLIGAANGPLVFAAGSQKDGGNKNGGDNGNGNGNQAGADAGQQGSDNGNGNGNGGGSQEGGADTGSQHASVTICHATGNGGYVTI